MLEDIYLEYMIKKKKTGGQVALIAALCVIAAALSFVLLALTFIFGVTLQQALTNVGQITSFIGLLLIAFVWYGAYLLISMQNVEYEYILTNSELDIDKIMSKKGRKPVVSFDFKTVTVCAPIDDAEHNGDYRNVKADKVIDAVGDAARGGVYFADYANENGEKVRVLFQPTAKLITSAKRFNPKNIFVTEE